MESLCDWDTPKVFILKEHIKTPLSEAYTCMCLTNNLLLNKGPEIEPSPSTRLPVYSNSEAAVAL